MSFASFVIWLNFEKLYQKKLFCGNSCRVKILLKTVNYAEIVLSVEKVLSVRKNCMNS